MRGLVPAASLFAWQDKVEPFLDGCVHAKVAVADGSVCFVTSANLTGYATGKKHGGRCVDFWWGNTSNAYDHLCSLVDT